VVGGDLRDHALGRAGVLRLRRLRARALAPRRARALRALHEGLARAAARRCRVSARTVLVTGANGYLGARIARALLEHTDDSLLLWLHAKDAAELGAKRARLEGDLAAPPGRVSFAG